MSYGQDLTRVKGKVSVVVPVFNVDKYLEECIQSLLTQTYPDLELILVDDGSQDSSGQICDRFAGHNVRVRVIHKPNGGLSSARNAGIRASRGDRVCFVDGDDWVEPTYVERLVSAAETSGADIAVCGFLVEEGDRRERVGFRRDGLLGAEDAVRSLYGPDYLAMTVVWNKIFPRKLFQECVFSEGMVHEDEQIIATLFLGVSRIVCVSEHLYHYRKRPQSITETQSSVVTMDAVSAYEERLDLLRRMSVGEDLVQLTVKRLLGIVLAQLGDGATGRRRYACPDSRADLLGKLAIYGPQLHPTFSSVAIWTRLCLASPKWGPLIYSFRCRLRSWARERERWLRQSLATVASKGQRVLQHG